MPTTPLLLSPAEIAALGGSAWQPFFPEGLSLTGISLDKNTTQPGDVYFRLEANNAQAGIARALKNGAVAVVVSSAVTLDYLDVPVLRVADPWRVLKKLAVATRAASKANRVLITGSYGKTGFKGQLHHVLTDTIKTHAVLNSNNSLKAICKSLALIRKSDAVTLVEVAVPSPTRGEMTTQLIQPQLCVITCIGLEHLRQNGGTQDHIISNKAKVVSGLPPQGRVIIPQQAGVVDRLTAVIKQYRPDVDIVMFGETDTCDAQLIHKKFQDNQWYIQARIGTQRVAYGLPLWEHYAPLSSVSVLLAVACLGGDVQAAAQRFATYQNVKSSGKVYQLERQHKRFVLYDQSTRIGIDAFKSTLQLMADITPANQGRKIAVFTEFYSLDNAPREVLNTQEFQHLFQQSGLACLYTAANFTEHITVLPDKRIWKNHSYSIVNIMDEIIDGIQQDDIVFVRGAVDAGEVGLDALVERLLQTSRIIATVY